MKSKPLLQKGLLALCAVVSLAACGGGGGGGGGGGPPPVTTTSVSGTVFAGPTSGAAVTVTDGTTVLAGPVTTDGSGRYEIAIPDTELGKDLWIEASGGTFTDEGSGSAATCGTLAAFAPANSLEEGAVVHLTPATTVHAGLVDGGQSTSAASEAFAAAFGFQPEASIAPQLDASAEEASRLAGLRAAAFSQFAADLGLAPDQQFGLLATLSQDLADGVCDGAGGGGPLMMGGLALPEDLQNRFVTALTSFRGSARDSTGLLPNQIGTLPFPKVALSDSYRVEYVEGPSPAVQGRTEFSFAVTALGDGSPVPGLQLSLTPKMHMSDRAHSTPLDGAVVDNGDGTYSASLYYLMSTRGANDVSMGYWELKVKLSDAESVVFYPDVGVPGEGNTARAVLWASSQADQAAGSTGATNRRYFLFNDGLTGDPGSQSLLLFLAAYDTMMRWPAVETGTVLYDANGAEWPVGSVELKFSTDATNWTPADDGGGGHWSLPGLTGLTAGTPVTVYVQLFVNGEQKTTDQNPAAEANGYATFTVTP